MSDKIAVRVKDGRLRGTVFGTTTVYFELDHGSPKQFLIEIPAISDRLTFRYKRLKVHVLNGEFVIQSDGLKVVLFNQDPIYDILLEKSENGAGKSHLNVKTPGSTTSNLSRSSLDKVTPSVIASKSVKSTEAIKKSNQNVVRSMTPEKSKPPAVGPKVNSPPGAASAAPRQIGYESPFKLRSPDLSAKITPNTAEVKKRQPQPLFPSHIIGQAATTPLRDGSLYDTTTASDMDAEDPTDPNQDGLLHTVAGTGASANKDLTPVKLRDQGALASLPDLFSRNPTVGSFTDVDIFSPKPQMKQYGNKRKVPLPPSMAPLVPSRYASPLKAPGIHPTSSSITTPSHPDVAGPAPKKAAIIPRAADSKSYWDSKPLHASDGRPTTSSSSLMSALNASSTFGAQRLSSPPEGYASADFTVDSTISIQPLRNRMSDYYRAATASTTSSGAAARAGGGGLLNDFMSIDAVEDPIVASPGQTKLRGGIRNLGNTCYMSATLQALMSSEVFMKDLESQFWSSLPGFLKLQQQSQQDQQQHRDQTLTSAESTEMDDSSMTFSVTVGQPNEVDKYEKCSLYRELLSLVNLKRAMVFNDPVLSSSQFGSNFVLNNSLDISKLRSAATKLTNKFHGFQQQDAHEFLNDFNSTLQDELHHYLTQYVTCLQQCNDYSSTDGTKSDSAAEGSPKKDLSFDSPAGVADMKSPPSSLLKGSLDVPAGVSAECTLLPASKCFNSTVEVRCVCKKCGFERPAREETYRDFSVELNDHHQVESLQLEQLFSSFFNDEERDLTCEHCQSATDVHDDKSDTATESTVTDIASSVVEEMTQPINSAPPSSSDSKVGKVQMSSKLVSLPEILVIHLKRFQYSYDSGSYRKVNCDVSFPLLLNADNCAALAVALTEQEERLAIAMSTGSAVEAMAASESLSDVLSSHPEKILLDAELSKRVLRCASTTSDSGRSSSVEYELYALVRHIGEESLAGHYICDVKKDQGLVGSLDDIESGVTSDFKLNWLRYNDAHVSKVTEDLVLSEQDTPYIFFYRKITSH